MTVVRGAEARGSRRRCSLARRLFHMAAGSVFPTLALFAPEGLTLALLGATTAIAIMAEFARFVFPPLNRWFLKYFGVLLRERESSHVTGATYLLLSSLLVFLVFDRGVAILSLFFLALGDPVAALVGERFGRRRVFGKSLEGALAFLATALILGLTLGTVQLGLSFPVVLLGAASAALIEVLPIPLDDNVTIPLLSGALMSLVGIFQGFPP